MVTIVHSPDDTFPTNKLTLTINNLFFRVETDDIVYYKAVPRFQQSYRTVFKRFLKYLGIKSWGLPFTTFQIWRHGALQGPLLASLVLPFKSAKP